MIQNIPNLEHSLSLWLVLQEFGQDFDSSSWSLLCRLWLQMNDYYTESSSGWSSTVLIQASNESLPYSTECRRSGNLGCFKWTRSAQDVTWLRGKATNYVPCRDNRLMGKTLGHILKILCCKFLIFYIFLKIQHLVDPDKHSLAQLETRRLSSFTRGFGIIAFLFPDGTLQNVTHTSPGNPV